MNFFDELANKMKELLEKEPQGYETQLLEELKDWLNNDPEFPYFIRETSNYHWELQKVNLLPE